MKTFRAYWRQIDRGDQVTKLKLCACLAALLMFTAACDKESGKPSPAHNSVAESVVDAAFEEQNKADEIRLSFLAESDEEGMIILRAEGFDYMYHKSSVMLQNAIYSFVEIPIPSESGNTEPYVNALVSIQPNTLQTELLFMEEMPRSSNPGFNSFLQNRGILGKLDDYRFLFMEPVVAEDHTTYHLSAYDARNGEFERVRADFWTVEDGDTIYQYKWNADKSKLMLQSFEGNVWIYDLAAGQDHIHLNRFRVIPHSTTGYPALFASPTLDRFVFDDESGMLALYNKEGQKLQDIALHANRYYSSEKASWNEAGTIFWIASSGNDNNRIKAADIDLLRIAPEHIDFYDLDGSLIQSVNAKNHKNGGSIEVAGWLSDDVAVMKEYLFDGTKELQQRETDITLFLLDVRTGKSEDYGQFRQAAPADAGKLNDFVIVQNDPASIRYIKARPVVNDINDASSQIESYSYKDSDVLATFRKIPDLPYGMFVPEMFEEKRDAAGFKLGYGEEDAWNGITVYNDNPINLWDSYVKTELNIYEEYAGSIRGFETTEDYFVISNRANEFLIKFTYTDDEQAAILPILLTMLGEIRYVYPEEQFETGVNLHYEPGQYSELELKLLSLVAECLQAIVNRDIPSFARTLESQNLAEALAYIMEDGRLYHFDELESIAPIDEERINIGIKYQARAQNGTPYDSAFTITVRQNEQGEWKIANID